MTVHPTLEYKPYTLNPQPATQSTCYTHEPLGRAGQAGLQYRAVWLSWSAQPTPCMSSLSHCSSPLMSC